MKYILDEEEFTRLQRLPKKKTKFLVKKYAANIDKLKASHLEAVHELENKAIVQAYCPSCDVLSKLLRIVLTRAPTTDTAMSIKVSWECFQCHDQFDTNYPYLEIKPMNPGDAL